MPSIPKILVVDDTPSNILAVEATVADCGVEVVKASSGAEALKLALSHQFALVLLDVEMPGMGGHEVATLLRSATRTRSVPIIFVSGMHFDRNNVFRGYESGAVDYIAKPIDPLVLKSKVRVFAELHQLRERELVRVAEEEKARYAEEKRQLLEAENAKLKVVLGNMMTTVALFDAATPQTPIFRNRTAPWLEQFDPEELYARDGTRLTPDQHAVTRALKGEMIFEEETFCKLRDGTQRSFLVSAMPIRDGAGTINSAIVSYLDVTARVAAEQAREAARQQLQAAYKMSALGEMAGGIAHEVNNPLSIIIGKARQLREVLEGDQIDRAMIVEFAAVIEDTSRRIVKIVNGLRTISRKSDRDPFVVTSLRNIVDGTLAICAAKARSCDVELTSEFDGTEPDVSCRPSELSQVLLNLLGNAFDAVEALAERWVRLSVRTHGTWIDITVDDSGPGIPAALREKILEPFFTTKEVDKGTGLGLSISKTLVEDHRGHLYIDDSAPNTRFVVRLPIAGASVGRAS